MQSSGGNCPPAPDLVLRKLIFQRIFLSRGVFFFRRRYPPQHVAKSEWKQGRLILRVVVQWFGAVHTRYGAGRYPVVCVAPLCRAHPSTELFSSAQSVVLVLRLLLCLYAWMWTHARMDIHTYVCAYVACASVTVGAYDNGMDRVCMMRIQVCMQTCVRVSSCVRVGGHACSCVHVDNSRSSRQACTTRAICFGCSTHANTEVPHPNSRGSERGGR